MNARLKLSVTLIGVGIILAFMPLSGRYSLSENPDILMDEIFRDDLFYTVDQVSRSVVSDDSTIQLIDLRGTDEFLKVHIPGAINVPYDHLLERDLYSLLKRENSRIIFYGNGDLKAGYAIVLARGLGFHDCFIMKGGLNEWFETVMNSSFTGTRITARENALFETRARATRMFNEYNSLPDSMKLKFAEAREIEAKKLDGGCE